MGQGQQALQIDRVCDEFETAWRMDSATRLEAFLSADPANEFCDDDVQNQNVAELFPWLLSLEVALRRSVGDAVLKEEYLARFPKWAERMDAEFAQATSRSSEPTTDRDISLGDSMTVRSLNRSAESALSGTALAAGEVPDMTLNSPAASAVPLSHVSAIACPPMIAGFELLEEIGRGGMGVVYRVPDAA